MKKVEFDKLQLFEAMGYHPHPGQLLFHNSPARFKVPICGWRWGKSMSASAEMMKYLVQPNRRLWIVGPTYDLGEKEFRYIWDWYFKVLKLPAVSAQYKPKSGKMVIRTPLNTVLEVRSAQHPKSLEGESLDAVLLSEAAKHKRSTWEWHLRARLTDRKGVAFFPTTPEGFNWIYDMYCLGQNPKFADWESWRFPTWSNPYIDPKELEDARGILSEFTFRQGYGAEFSALAGRVYSDFDDGVHVGEFNYNPAWPCYRIIDWGYTSPFCCLTIQTDPQDRIYVIDEYYERGRIVADHAEALQHSQFKNVWWGADDEDPEAIAVFQQKGIKLVALNTPSISSGCDLVRSFLKIRDDERPGLYVDKSCTNTIDEFHMYRYPENKHREFEKEVPVDKDNHAMDCVRNFAWRWMRSEVFSRVDDTVRVESSVNFGELGL